MLLALLSFFATRFFYLALHLESGSFPRPFSAAQEQDAFTRLRAGDAAAREELVRHNLRLVAHIAKKYFAQPGDQEDLLSIGVIGLLKAIDTFDHTRKARFSTYASKCIENEIRMHLRKTHRAPVTLSLEDTLESAKDGTALTVMDVLQDETDLVASSELQDEIDRLRAGLDTLPPRERTVIALRYGLENTLPLTQQEVAARLGISRSYVSRLETHALGLLRRKLASPAARRNSRSGRP